jgi:hypothetical protein
VSAPGSVGVHLEFIITAAVMDHGGEALISLLGAERDVFEFLELAEEVFDQVTPFVHLRINREGRDSARMLGE